MHRQNQVDIYKRQNANIARNRAMYILITYLSVMFTMLRGLTFVKNNLYYAENNIETKHIWKTPRNIASNIFGG